MPRCLHQRGLFVLFSLDQSVYSLCQSFKNLMKVILQSTITCPECNYSKEETMPADACRFFYECENCKEVLKPKEGDCCVFCSYGTVPCPPIQESSKDGTDGCC